ncbi:MAG: phosphoenolpyruvate carboxykinase (GTP), partial [Microthrixaceae bacterium]
WAAILSPTDVHWCNGSVEERDRLCEVLVDSGTFVRLSESLRPDSFLARSSPGDVARVEDRTFVSTRHSAAAGPNNNWRHPAELRPEMLALFDGAMGNRTMYVVPFSMGPVGAPGSLIGVQLTDSAYVAVSMGVMTRMGADVLDLLGDGDFVSCVHSVGAPLSDGEDDVVWPCNPHDTCIAHFPEDHEVWSYGSGYGGNALLGKKSLALRIASAMAYDEGTWLAEHMATIAVTDPEGQRRYIAAALPSGCGKTDLAMMNPALPGWSVEVIGDDISWIRLADDGHLYSMNPEAGFFGLAPGISVEQHPVAAATVRAGCIFTNVALTDDGDVWWEGMDGDPPAHLIDWQGRDWTPDTGTSAAHPNARFAVRAENCSTLAPEWETPGGVPLSAILLGGRRPTTMPLVVESESWEHGVFMGASLCSETTAAATGPTGVVRHDPFAMQPFCGYHMADYFGHWLYVGSRTESRKLPRIFSVNWFREDADGDLLWPGFDENIRVLQWVLGRCDATADAVATPIGAIPAPGSLNVDGLDMDPERLAQLLDVDHDDWQAELHRTEQYFATLGDRLPAELLDELDATAKRLAE